MGKTGVDWIDLLSNSDFSDFEWDVELVDVLLSLPSDRHPNRRQGGRFAISSTEVPDILSKVPSAPDWRLDYNLRLPNLERLVTATQALLADQPVGDDLDLAEYAHYWRSRERLQVVARTCFPAFGQGERRVFQWNVAVAATNRREGRVVYSLHGTDGRDGNAVSRALDPKVIDSIETAVSAVRTSLGVTDGLDDLVIGVSAVPASHQPTAYRDFGGRSGTLALAVALAAAWSGDKPGMLLRNCLFTGDLDDQGNIIQVEGGEDLDKARAADDYGFRVFYDNSNRVYESTSFDAVRSQGLRDVWIHLTNYRRELLEWVRSKIDELDRLVEPLGGPDLASAYEAVPCRVLKREVTLEPLSTNSDASDEEAQVHPAEPTSLEEQIAGGSAFREQSVAQEFRGTSAVLSEWNDLADVPLVIVGDPGTGKTFLTRSIARQQLRNWMESLDRGDRNSRFVLWIQLERLKGLADDLESLPKPSDDDTATVAIDFLIKVLAPANENLRIQLSKALLEEPLDLVFDGFDQATFLHGVEPESRSQSWGVSSDRALPHRRILGRLVDRMRSECRDHDVRVMAVTRPIARDALLKEFPPPDELFPTYEVAGFDVASLKAFVGVRLRESASQEVVLEQFQRAIVAREIFLVPYLLGLVCRLAEVGRLKQTDQLNRFELFERVVKLQITEAVGSDAEVKVAAPLRVLSHMSATLWDSHAGRCLFTLREWQDALVDSADRVAQGADPAYIEQVLRKARLFDLGVEDSDAWSSPAHRMILEFLRSYLLKRHLDLLGWEKSDETFPHSVEQICVFKGWDPQWREVFLFLAAHLAEREVEGVIGGWMVRYLRLIDGTDTGAWEQAGWSQAVRASNGAQLPTDDLLNNRFDLSLRCLRQFWRLYIKDSVTVPREMEKWATMALRRARHLARVHLVPALPALYTYRRGRLPRLASVPFHSAGYDASLASPLLVNALIDAVVEPKYLFEAPARSRRGERSLYARLLASDARWSTWVDGALLQKLLTYSKLGQYRKITARTVGLCSQHGGCATLTRLMQSIELGEMGSTEILEEIFARWVQHGSHDLLTRLIEIIEKVDLDVSVRCAASRVVGEWSRWGSGEIMERLVLRLEDSQESVKEPGEIAHSESVRKLLYPEPPNVRAAVARALTHWSKWAREGDAARLLLQVQRVGDDPAVRAAAATALGNWSAASQPELLRQLIRQMQKSDDVPEVRAAVIVAVAQLTRIGTQVGRPSGAVVLRCITHLMLDRSADPIVRAHAAQAAGGLHQFGTSKLLQSLFFVLDSVGLQYHEKLRVETVKAIGLWSRSGSVEMLKDLFDRLDRGDEVFRLSGTAHMMDHFVVRSELVQGEVARAIGLWSALGSPLLLERLLESVEAHPDRVFDHGGHVRMQLARGAGRWSRWADAGHLKRLMSAHAHDYHNRGRRAIDTAKEAMLSSLLDTDPDVRSSFDQRWVKSVLAKTMVDWQLGPDGPRRFFNEGMFLVADLSRLPD